MVENGGDSRGARPWLRAAEKVSLAIQERGKERAGSPPAARPGGRRTFHRLTVIAARESAASAASAANKPAAAFPGHAGGATALARAADCLPMQSQTLSYITYVEHCWLFVVPGCD